MIIVFADVNARTEDDRIVLRSEATIADLQASNANPGDWVFLGDGDCRVGAQLESDNGHFLGRPAWETFEDKVPDETIAGARGRKARDELQEWLSQPPAARDNPRLIALIPYIGSAPSPGLQSLVRCQALYGLGYRELALLATEEGLQLAPGEPRLVFWRQNILRGWRQAQALREAQDGMTAGLESVVVACAYAHTFQHERTLAPGRDGAEMNTKILAVTDQVIESGLQDQRERPTAWAGLFVFRGFTFLHRGDTVQAVDAFSQAISLAPSMPEVRIVRALITYPSSSALADLEVAQRAKNFFVPDWLFAHQAVLRGEWNAAAEHAHRAMCSPAPPAIQDQLRSWATLSERADRGGGSDRKRVELAQAPVDVAMHLEPQLSVAPAA